MNKCVHSVFLVLINNYLLMREEPFELSRNVIEIWLVFVIVISIKRRFWYSSIY